MYCKRYFQNNDKNKINRIELYKNTKIYKTFENDKALAQFYFQAKFKDNDVVFCDARFLDRPLLKQTHQIKNIFVFHSSHLSGNNIKKSYKFTLEHSKGVYKYIVLTEQQERDIKSVYPIEDQRFKLIPHFIEIADDIHTETHKKKGRFIYIGRFSAEKQIDHLIKAYRQFLQSGHQTQLHLFGRDEDQQLPLIKSLISKLQLHDKVKILDYTKNPLTEFKTSKASLLTSKYEGFGLTIMESIEMGCPALSYNIPYGPSEIIKNGENGYLYRRK
nr:glycosyltransferase [Staphylococcus saccharolyticus]